MFEKIDFEKVEQEKIRLQSEIAKVNDLETQVKDLESLEQLANWYLAEKRASMKEVDITVNGEPTGQKSFPYRTPPGFRAFNWLSHYSFLAIYKGWENASRFLASHDTEEALEKASKEQTDDLRKRPEFVRLKRFLEKFTKVSKESSESKPVEVAV